MNLLDIALPSVADPNLVNTLVAVFSSVLMSVFKSESWTKETKQKVSMVIAVLVGVGVALYTDKTSLTDFVAFTGMAAGIMQAFYLGLWEKFGAENIARVARSHVIDASKVLVTGGNNNHTNKISSSSTDTTDNDDIPAGIVKAINEVNEMLAAWRAGVISDSAAVSRMNDIRKLYGDILPPFPANYPL